MPVKTITIAGKAEPEYGKKRGRIKDIDGMIFQIDPLMLSQAVVGQVYNVTYKDDEFKGAKFRVVEDIVPANGSIPAPSRPSAPSQRISAPTPSTSKDDDISVLAIVKEWVGRIPVGDEGALVHALKVTRRAWLKSKQPDSQIESGKLDDDIPY